MCRELGPLRLPSASPNRGPSYHVTRRSRAQAQAERIVTPMKIFYGEQRNTLLSRATQLLLGGALKGRVLLLNTSYDVIKALYMIRTGLKGSANAMNISYGL